MNDLIGFGKSYNTSRLVLSFKATDKGAHMYILFMIIAAALGMIIAAVKQKPKEKNDNKKAQNSKDSAMSDEDMLIGALLDDKISEDKDH